MHNVRTQRPRLPSLRDILPEESLNAPFTNKSHGYPMLPSTTAFSEPDMDRLTLAPFAPQPSAFGQHAKQMPPSSAAPCLPSPRSSPVLGHPQMPTRTSAGAPAESPPCSLDILRLDPEMPMLWHFAPIPTRSTGPARIPAVPRAGDGAFPARGRTARHDHHEATGHNALVDGPGAAPRRSLLEGARSDRAAAHGHARPDIRSFAPPASPEPRSSPASSSFGRWFDNTPAYANGAQEEHLRKAVWAQDDSQRETARRTPRRRRGALPPAGEASASERGTYADADARDRAFVAGVGVKRRKPIHATHKHVCPLCRRTFNRPSGLRVHEYSHIGHRPFKCLLTDCGRTFTMGWNMRRHLRRHFPPGPGGDEEWRHMQKAAMSATGFD